MKTGTIVKHNNGDVAIWTKGSDNLKHVDHVESDETHVVALCYGEKAYYSILSSPVISRFEPLSLEEFMSLPTEEREWLEETRRILQEPKKVSVPISEIPRMNLMIGTFVEESIVDVLGGKGVLALFYCKDGRLYVSCDGKDAGTIEDYPFTISYLSTTVYNRCCEMGLKIVLPENA